MAWATIVDLHFLVNYRDIETLPGTVIILVVFQFPGIIFLCWNLQLSYLLVMD
jgi:hypothetical protein